MTQLTPRKRPRQERALATVEALLEATHQLLVEQGYAHTNTNQIAARAGVSIGSLYQYFPNKDALVAELVKQYFDAQLEVLAASIAEILDQPLEMQILTFVKSLLKARNLKPDLTRIFFTEVPRLGDVDYLGEWFEQTVTLTLASLVARHDEPGLRTDNLELVAVVCVGAVDGVVMSAALHRAELLEDDNLAEEVAQLILGYLKPGYLPQRP